MKWIVKQQWGKWLRRCPYCNATTLHGTKPSDNFVCQCKAIVNPEMYLKLKNLARACREVIK